MKAILKKANKNKAQSTKWIWGWKLKDGSIPIRGGTNSLYHAITSLMKGWVYAFKYPTTVSKTFWQVLVRKTTPHTK